MFIYSNTQQVKQHPVGFETMTIDGTYCTFVKNVVWDTDNVYFGFRYPTLFISALPNKKEADEDREGYCEFGINEFSAEHAHVYRFSPRDMLATIEYLEDEDPAALPDDEEQKEKFCQHFASRALAETGENRLIQGVMYWAVVGFFEEVYRRYEKSENNE